MVPPNRTPLAQPEVDTVNIYNPIPRNLGRQFNQMVWVLSEMDYLQAKLDFRRTPNERVIEQCEFEHAEFDTFCQPSPGPPLVLRKVTFISCRSKYSAMLRYNIKLDRVLFQNFACPSKLDCSSEAIVREVTVIGSKPHGLLIIPQNETGPYEFPDGADVDFFLDISKYRGHVEVCGFPRSKVIIDPERHVAVSGELFDTIDWQGLGFDAVCWFRMICRLVKIRSAVEGVFSFPKPKDSKHEAAVRDRQRLEELGYKFY